MTASSKGFGITSSRSRNRRPGWRLLINLCGQHEYNVEPEVRLLGASQTLLLNVVGAASA
jgi:hypothetical protein